MVPYVAAGARVERAAVRKTLPHPHNATTTSSPLRLSTPNSNFPFLKHRRRFRGGGTTDISNPGGHLRVDAQFVGPRSCGGQEGARRRSGTCTFEEGLGERLDHPSCLAPPKTTAAHTHNTFFQHTHATQRGTQQRSRMCAQNTIDEQQQMHLSSSKHRGHISS